MKKLSTLLILALILQGATSNAQSRNSRNMKVAAAAPTTKNISNDIDDLGGNEELVDMAQRMKSTTRSRIVQERIVDRRNKVEFGVGFGGVFGGDAYLQTKALNFAADYHITPRWSIGARYLDFSNDLNPEGERVLKKAQEDKAANNKSYFPGIDYPQSATYAVVNWYPIYGKTSFLDIGVTQFDMYLLAGGGTIQLSSGSTALYTGGLGIGAWMSRHITARAEIRYQTYQDNPASGSRSLDTYVGSFGLGWIL
jgi:outer membrane beta-barrel protein